MSEAVWEVGVSSWQCLPSVGMQPGQSRPALEIWLNQDSWGGLGAWGSLLSLHEQKVELEEKVSNIFAQERICSMHQKVRVSGLPWSPLEVGSQCNLPSRTSILTGVFPDYVREQPCALWDLSVDDFEVEEKAFGSCLGTKVSLKSVVVWSTPCAALASTEEDLETLFQMPVAATCEEGVRSITGPKEKEWWELGRRDQAEIRAVPCSLCFWVEEGMFWDLGWMKGRGQSCCLGNVSV